LQKWTFPVHSLTISGDKNCRPTDVFLDDSTHVIESLEAMGHPRPVLWSHAANQSHTLDAVRGWDEFLAVVESEAGPLPAVGAEYAVY
jgi:hypothetical protein